MVHATHDYLALLCVKATASLILLFLSHANVLKNVSKIMVSQIDNQRGGGIGGGGGGVWGKGGSGGGRVVKSLISSGYRSIVYIIADDSDQLQRMKY